MLEVPPQFPLAPRAKRLVNEGSSWWLLSGKPLTISQGAPPRDNLELEFNNYAMLQGVNHFSQRCLDSMVLGYRLEML